VGGVKERRSMTKYQLRMYDVKPDAMAEFLEVFPNVVAARRANGMDVVSAWVDAENNRFVWIVSGPDDFDAAAGAYMESPQRRSMKPEPGDFIERMDTAMVEPAM
jgi:F420-0:gamma-glutamyl ligase